MSLSSAELFKVEELSRRLGQQQQEKATAKGQLGKRVDKIRRGNESPDVTEGLRSIGRVTCGKEDNSMGTYSNGTNSTSASSSSSSSDDGDDDNGCPEDGDDDDDDDEEEEEEVNSAQVSSCASSSDSGGKSDPEEIEECCSSRSSSSSSTFPEFPPQLDFMGVGSGGNEKTKRRTDRYDSSESSDSGVATLSPSTSDSTELISSPYSPCCDLSSDASSTISSNGSPSSCGGGGGTTDILLSVSPEPSPPPPTLHREAPPPPALQQISLIKSVPSTNPSPSSLLGHPIMTAVSAVLAAAGDSSASSKAFSNSKLSSSTSAVSTTSPVTNFISFQIPTNNNNQFTTANGYSHQQHQKIQRNATTHNRTLMAKKELSGLTGSITESSTATSFALNCDVIRPLLGSSKNCSTTTSSTSPATKSSNGPLKNSAVVTPITPISVAVSITPSSATGIKKETASSASGGAIKNIFAAALNFHQQQKEQKLQKQKVEKDNNNINNNNNSTTLNKNHNNNHNTITTGVALTTKTAIASTANAIIAPSPADLKSIKSTASTAVLKSFTTILHGEGQRNKVVILSPPQGGSKVNCSADIISATSTTSASDLQSQLIQKSLNNILTSNTNKSSKNTAKSVSLLPTSHNTTTSTTTTPITTTTTTLKSNNKGNKKARLNCSSLSPTRTIYLPKQSCDLPKKSPPSTECKEIKDLKSNLSVVLVTGPKKTENSPSITAVKKLSFPSNSSSGCPTSHKSIANKRLSMSSSIKSQQGDSPAKNRLKRKFNDESASVLTSNSSNSGSSSISSVDTLIVPSSRKYSLFKDGISSSSSSSDCSSCSRSGSDSSSHSSHNIKKSEKRSKSCSSSLEMKMSSCVTSSINSGLCTLSSSVQNSVFSASVVGALPLIKPETGCMWKGCKVKLSLNIFEHIQTGHVAGQIKAEGYVCLWEGCKVYNKKSSSLSWLERHVLTHSGNKPFKCIFPGCGQSFGAQGGLERHVNSHISTNGSITTGGPHSTSTMSRGKLDSSPLKGSRRKKQRCRKQRLNIGQFVDYFDKRVMEVIKHRLATSMDFHTVSAHECTFRGQVVARRTAPHQEPQVLVHWFPESIIADEWVLQKQYKETKLVPLTGISKEKLPILYPTLFPIQRRDKCSRKIKSYSSESSSCSSGSTTGSLGSSSPLTFSSSTPSPSCSSVGWTGSECEFGSVVSKSEFLDDLEEDDEGIGSCSRKPVNRHRNHRLHKKSSSSSSCNSSNTNSKSFPAPFSTISPIKEECSVSDGDELVHDWAMDVLMEDSLLLSSS